jgi:hypothetical protein
MTTVIFVLLTLALVFANAMLGFFTNTALVLRRGYTYQSQGNTIYACLVYGDYLVRSGASPGSQQADNAGCSKVSANSCNLPVGCLSCESNNSSDCAWPNTAHCMESLSCTITLVGNNKINVSLNH